MVFCRKSDTLSKMGKHIFFIVQNILMCPTN